MDPNYRRAMTLAQVGDRQRQSLLVHRLTTKDKSHSLPEYTNKMHKVKHLLDPKLLHLGSTDVYKGIVLHPDVEFYEETPRDSTT